MTPFYGLVMELFPFIFGFSRFVSLARLCRRLPVPRQEFHLELRHFSCRAVIGIYPGNDQSRSFGRYEHTTQFLRRFVELQAFRSVHPQQIAAAAEAHVRDRRAGTDPIRAVAPKSQPQRTLARSLNREPDPVAGVDGNFGEPVVWQIRGSHFSAREHRPSVADRAFLGDIAVVETPRRSVVPVDEALKLPAGVEPVRLGDDDPTPLLIPRRLLRIGETRRP